jgi:hypothetical protein
MMCVICCDPESEFTILHSGHSTEVRRSTNMLLASILCSSRSRGGQQQKKFFPRTGSFHLNIIFVLQREIFVMHLLIVLCNL